MKIRAIFILVIVSFMFSCKTYTISVDSFREQMKESTSESLKNVEINHPLLKTNLKYVANNIKSITVIDKKGNKVTLINSPKLEMRVTRKDGKKNIMYFDSVIIENDTLNGARSRFIENLRTKIHLSDIEKIEIQDSGKVYEYQ